MSEPIANVDMANAWDGEEGDQWTQFADEYDTSVRSIWARFLETDPIAPADRVLDIGCGSGQSTRDAARLARDGSALGVDLSESMLAEARRRASTEGLTNVEFLRADAQVHAFDTATFDLAISRFGSMFFSDRPAAFANIASALDIILDLSGLTHFDLNGVDVFLDALGRMRKRGGELTLSAPSPMVGPVLECTGLNRRLPITRL
jgi:SAM-dependent methyltransferase